MKEEFKRIKKLGKEIIGKESYKKVKKIKDYTERTEGLKHLMYSKFHLKLLDIEHKLEKLQKKEKDILNPKVIRLRSKIKIFNSTHEKKDYENLKNLIKNIEEGLKNV